MPGPTDPPPTATDDDRLLYAFVADRDTPCPACGYNLRQLSRAVCPECGLVLKLSVGSDTPFRRAWAITLVLNAMIAGVGAMFLLIMTVEGPPQIRETEVAVVVYAPILWMPVPLVLLLMRRRFCAFSASFQKGCVWATLLVLASLAGMTLSLLL